MEPARPISHLTSSESECQRVPGWGCRGRSERPVVPFLLHRGNGPFSRELSPSSHRRVVRGERTRRDCRHSLPRASSTVRRSSKLTGMASLPHEIMLSPMNPPEQLSRSMANNECAPGPPLGVAVAGQVPEFGLWGYVDARSTRRSCRTRKRASTRNPVSPGAKQVQGPKAPAASRLKHASVSAFRGCRACDTCLRDGPADRGRFASC